MIKRPATIATEINDIYVKNESMSFHIAWDEIYHFFTYIEYIYGRSYQNDLIFK